MKKLFSFIMVALMSIMTLNAENTRIYCKMAQNWWKVDNAAVGCHSWGTPGPGTSWPGVRMTPVEGETDMWYIDLDVTKVQNVIFTRVNPSGDIADWGAKTGDLVIPTNGDNLFTITKSSECWAGNDCTCDGEWSVYGGAVEKPKHDYTITAYLPEFCAEIANYADSVRVMGGFDDWSNGIYMQKIVDEDFNDCWYAEIKDVEEGTEFKLRFGTDAEWKVQVQLDGQNLGNERTGETTDIVLQFDGAGYGFAACAVPAARKEFVFVAGEAAEANPTMFAITWGKDGSSETVKMTQKGEEALYTAEILETVDSLVLVRCASDATEIIWDGEGKNVWNQTANYELCDTMSFVAWVEDTNLFAVTCEAPQPVETKYYAKNNWNNGDWAWLEMTKEEDLYVLDSVVFGGTGVNINTKEDDTDAKWFALKDMTYVGEDTIQALDTVRFELAISKEDTVLTAIKLGRPAPAARKEFVFVAGEAADSDPALFAITWGKDGSNETVKLANKADDIYTAEILETVDSLVLVRCATDATEIIWDGEGKNVWNQTANYELCDTMSFVAWVEETNLFTITCDTPQPVETKYYAKNNWNNGDWTWLEMIKEEDLYVLDSVVFGGTGVNINTKEDDTDALWFALKDMTYVGEDTIQALDTVRFELAISKEDTVLTAIKLGRPAPAARKEFVFVAGEAAEANPALFAITWGKDGSNETVKLANKADDMYTAEILETVDSLVLVRCATGATEIIWDGEGKNVWNQTANYELCDTMSFVAWVEDTNLFTITCDTPQPVETKYYAKNNWNGAAADDWSWLEMSATDKENIYMLDSVVFGGTGVNINDKEDDTDALWFAADKIVVLDGLDGLPAPIPPAPQKRDTIPYAPARMVAPLEAPTLLAGDTIKLFFNAADSTLSAAIVGRPAPAARKEFVFVAGEAAEANPALFAITWGKDGSNETVKLANKADDMYTAEILETVDSLVLVRCASDATEIIWDGEGKNVWNQTANYALCDTMYFESWVPETNLFAVTCEAPQPVGDKYYVTGNAALVGEEKAWQADAIEMVDYTHTFPMLAAGEYQLKVTDGTWEHAWGYDNLSPTVAVEGLYTDVDGNICFTVYTPNDVTVTFAQGYVVVTGDFKNPQPAEEGFGIIVNGTEKIKGQKNEEQVEFLEYMIEANLTAGATFQLYDFANDAPWTEANIDEASTKNVTINTDNLYEAAATGKYTIYLKMYGPENNQVYFAFTGDPTGLIEIMLNAKDGKFIINGNMIIRRNGALYTIQGARL